MIRAMLLNLLGTNFEVRLINLKSGKDLPGTCLYKGRYRKARRVFLDKQIKYGTLIRLQAVTILDHHINSIKPRDDEIAPVEAVNPLEEAKLMASAGEPLIPYNSLDAHPPEENYPNKERYAAATIADDAVVGVHDCDNEGPLEYLNARSGYVPTCSVCGEIP